MSLPLTEVEFDDEIDRSWSRFHSALVSQLSGITADQVVSYVRERPETDDDSTAPDLSFRQLHDGVICAVMAVDLAIPAEVLPLGWSRTGPDHLTGVATVDQVGDLVEVAILSARRIWGITHPSFLRTVTPRSVPDLRSRAASMADHPSGGIGRAVRRVVAAHLAGSVEVDHYQALELKYPGALVQLQLWEVERSALLWTTIRGVVDPARLPQGREIVESWPGLELVVEGRLVDVELAVDLGDRPTRSMIAALDRWHSFMQDGYPALIEALVRPVDESDCAVVEPVAAVLRRHRDGVNVTAAESERLTRSDRTVLFESLDTCRRQSLSWMSWAERRGAVGDSDGSTTAYAEAQVWDLAYTTVSTALRQAVSPRT